MSWYTPFGNKQVVEILFQSTTAWLIDTMLNRITDCALRRQKKIAELMNNAGIIRNA